MKSKKVLCICLMLCLWLVFADATAWAAEEGCIYGTTVTAQRGQTVSFPVMIKNNPGIAATLIQITWESDDISLAVDSSGTPRIQAGTIFKTGNVTSTGKEKSAVFAWFGDSNNTQNGTACSVYFNISEQASYGAYDIQVECLQAQTVNAQEEPVQLHSEAGEIVVENPAPCIYGETIQTKQDTVIDYHVYIKNNPGICAVAFYLKPDCADASIAAVLDEDGNPMAEKGTFSEKGSVLTSKFEDGWKVLWYTTEKNQKQDGSLFSIKLKVSDSAEGDCPIVISPLTENLVDENGRIVAIPNVQNGKITVQKIYYGDADGNQKVDFGDVLYLKRLHAGWKGYTLRNEEGTDVNQDGKIDMEDILILEKHLAGWKGYDTLPRVIETQAS